MTPFVVAAFKDRPAAQGALDRLRSSGIATGSAHLHETTSNVTNAGALELDEFASGGFFGSAAEVLDELFGTRPDEGKAQTYGEMVRREATLVSVQVYTSDAAARVCDLFRQAGAERVSSLPQRGLES